jgi:hypothetical protein
MYPLLTVDEEEDHVGFGDSSKRLITYSFFKRFVTPLDDSSSINDEEMSTRPIRGRKIAVSGDARLVIYYCYPCSDNPVEEG